ncbi:RloB family protein [Lacticaseibacillus zhaodongensis]|uniref:RloB family protein n=1 Tax=Lacticaseibacillus zhaodongensis TaxID=2668065 RepID=UPI0012D31DE2|nr:RloB family protein [Lacticaseibacillus zhaodongensis]
MSNNFKKRFARTNRKAVNQIEPILIVSEGTETEPNYFRGFQTYIEPTIKAVGTGTNTIDVVYRAIDERDRVKDNPDKRYDQVWCVFDRDQFPAERFREAIKLANQEGIHLAYSIESFELWILFHFSYFESEIGRKAYIQKIDGYFKKLGFAPYAKNDPDIYAKLLDFQHTALANAERLEEKQQSEPDILKRDPITTVNHLVMALNAMGKDRFKA